MLEIKLTEQIVDSIMKVKEGKEMKKFLKLVLAGMMVVSMAACSTPKAGKYTAGTYTGEGTGFGGAVVVTITTDAEKITEVTAEGAQETAGIGGAALETLAEKALEAQSAEFDGVSGATVTSDAFKAGLAAAIAKAEGNGADESAALAFTAGTYNGVGAGYLGDVELAVTFSESAVTGIEIVAQAETDHVGTSAYEILFADIIAANGTGVDALSGATFTSRAIKEAVNAAAEAAGATNMEAFKKNTVTHEAGEDITGTWDVVVVGAGGAGMMAAAQAAMDGNTVLIIEANAEIGGNTLVSGGAYQSAFDAVVWDPENPDATEAVYDGETYTKVKNDPGRIDTLKTILAWSEEPFDGTIDADHPFVAGDVALNAVRGVHEEYLPVLKTLKAQITEYLAWAQPQLDKGVAESQITLFSTNELHLFQTYYGGLRPNADYTKWIYSDVELAKQFVEGSAEIKPWLEAQGADIDTSRAFTLIGCLWQRENSVNGGTVNGEFLSGKWGGYFAVPANTVLTANEANKIMTRTTATGLVTNAEGRVTGVDAVMFDGTKVSAEATKGVIIATGGYAANIDLVQETNDYWKDEFIADNIGTTNRNSLMGSGITMAVEAGAATVGDGWTQMMPLGWVDNGNLAGGAGENVIYVNAATGKRYVDESAERDVLSEGGFENGMAKEQVEKLGLKYVPGIYVEISNTGVTAGTGGFDNEAHDVPGRMYFRTVEETAEMIGCDAETLRETIVAYDNYVMGVSDELEVDKLSYRGTVGQVETDENGNYKPETYNLEYIRVRFMAPSTHHTMSGLKVDLNRHVLDAEGNWVEGLYAAGEVTGGFHAGNRLGGNAVTEIIVSGRVAGQAVTADNQ